MTPPKTSTTLKRVNTRLLLALCIGIVALIGYFITTNYFTWLQKSKEEVLHRLMAVTQTGSIYIDGDAHERIANQYMAKDQLTQHDQDSAYLRLHGQLSRMKVENNLQTPLYTIVYYNRDSTFHFIGTSSDRPYFRHSYKNYPKDLITHFQSGGILDTYEDENGIWLSAFSPIRNKRGQVVALLEADENFERVVAKAKSELIKNSMISLAIIIPFGFMLVTYFSRTLKKQEQDQEMLLIQKEEIQTQNEEIKTQNDFIDRQNQELDQRVKDRTIELETANSELANFLYHSSHDVQAPIATLKGLETLALQETKEEITKNYLQLIGLTVSKMERMVKTIQLVHSIKTTTPTIETIDLRQLIEDVYLQMPLKNNHTRLNFEIADNLIIANDASRLRTAVHELLKNTFQYNDSKVDLEIRITAKEINQQIVLKIEDNGVGLPVEAKEELFSMFKRGNEKSTGIGLGLYIAQISINTMKGRIEVVESAVGAVFKISLPKLVNCAYPEKAQM